MSPMQKFANSPQQYLRSVTDHPSAQVTEIHGPVGLLPGMLGLHYHALHCITLLPCITCVACWPCITLEGKGDWPHFSLAAL